MPLQPLFSFYKVFYSGCHKYSIIFNIFNTNVFKFKKCFKFHLKLLVNLKSS